MQLISGRRNSRRIWLFWPFLVGAMIVGVGTGIAELAMWLILPAVLVYVSIVFFAMGLLGARLEWHFDLTNSEDVVLDIIIPFTISPVAKHVVLVDGQERAAHRRGLWQIFRAEIEFGVDPVHRAQVTVGGIARRRLSLAVDGQPLVEL